MMMEKKDSEEIEEFRRRECLKGQFARIIADNGYQHVEGGK